MANPRQRRKQRSGTAKVKSSKQSLKNKHKVIVKGPEELAKAWDKTKTVRQNYAALGLLSTLDPRQAGGLEHGVHTPFAVSSATPATVEDLEAALEAELSSSSDEEDDEPVASTSTAAPPKKEKLQPGMARIIRDEQGNVVRIVVGGENGEEIEEDIKAPDRSNEPKEEDEDEDEDDESDEEENPWGEPMKDWDVSEVAPDAEEDVDEDEEMDVGEPRAPKQGIPIDGALRKVTAKTDVVRALEARAAVKTKVIRHSSSMERDWLVSLVAKYDDDISKMARDRKVNVWQKTPGELKRMIAKAGGLDKLRAQAAESA
ncbi:hypothetical protein JCM1841_004067 [Sporobolomyces salmonicolor]